MKVGIIGGGIVGLSSAYYLRKAGTEVIVFDNGDFTGGCSWGNAGMVVPSHVIPLASPGMISKGIRWMFNSESPFYVRLQLSRDLMKWGYKFYQHATNDHVERSIPALKDISLMSKSLYQEWSKTLSFDFGYQERGLLMLYQSTSAEKEERETVHQIARFGVEAHILSPEEIRKMEPDVQVNVKGGVYYPGDAHLSPQLLMSGFVSLLKEMGVVLKSCSEVSEIKLSGGSAVIRTTDGETRVDELVIASGSWSGMIASMIGISLPMQGGKGYSFTIPDVIKNIRIPSIFLEARVAVTPMGNSLRFGGTMEIAGIDHRVNMSRVKGIVDSIPTYYPEMKIAMPRMEDVWHGLRPCSPDGLPYIGRSERHENVTIATGHSMMGLSLGPATGKLVSEIITHEKQSISIQAFRPERFDLL